ncbi:alpha-xenorhabdolysin family binary toxin subunit A [Rugamonas sp. CCM 8940]|uniref:alpha-xenorhabdolysin family binary toxin subunit A n=1 Tax=Rugamonas sp. CCM 8940 TaxID=2765359 RepID=UPI0018F5C89D|nr:alpha-xenorhabdolysin family binary toxin subunit A [Rugamonas sp. CCM 8940]MBJ7310456.1 alpha-xenorhabdolysin family binary toxin subunit A [Rugamonas sp. CCM 8940]
MAQAQSVVDLKIDPVDIPKVALSILTGQQEGVSRAAGIFTKDDLINIKLYVKKGLSLPVTQIGVETYVGYTHAGIAGLEPVDIKDLFQKINSNVLAWDNVEKSSLQQSIDLDIAAVNITSTGDDIVSIIDQMPIMSKIKTTLGQISDAQLGAITFENDDKEVSVELGKILASMRKEIGDHQVNTAEVKTLVSDFRIEIAGGMLSNGTAVSGLEPQVHQKNTLMEKNNLKATITRLDEEIKEKNDRITQCKADYDKYVGLAFSGAAGGLIGLAITGGIFGDKAEKARKEKNELIDQVRILQDQVNEKKALQKAIENLQSDFNDIGTRMIDAEVALNNLEYMWQNMLSQIDESQRQFTSINDGLSLTRFVVAFKKVVAPWREVKDSAQALVKTFNEGLLEYKKLYANKA